MDVYSNLNLALEIYETNKAEGKTDEEILAILNKQGLPLHQDTTNTSDLALNMANIQFELDEFNRRYPDESRENGIAEFQRKIKGNPVCLDAKVEALVSFLTPETMISIENPEPALGDILSEIIEKLTDETISNHYTFVDYLQKNTFGKLRQLFYSHPKIRAFMNTYQDEARTKVEQFLTTMKPDLVDSEKPHILYLEDDEHNNILSKLQRDFDEEIAHVRFEPFRKSKLPIKKGKLLRLVNGDYARTTYDLFVPDFLGVQILEVETDAPLEPASGASALPPPPLTKKEICFEEYKNGVIEKGTVMRLETGEYVVASINYPGPTYRGNMITHVLPIVGTARGVVGTHRRKYKKNNTIIAKRKSRKQRKSRKSKRIRKTKPSRKSRKL
jgi:hypothetical protein